MKTEEIEKIAVFTATVIIFISTVVKNLMKRVHDSINKKTLLKFTKNSTLANEECIKLLNRSESWADRIYRCYAHNSGGTPRVGKPYYSTAIKSYYRDKNREDRISDYKNVELDDASKAIINDLIENKSVFLQTEYMDDSILKSIYLQEGVKFAKLYYLDISKTDMFYCSISWYNKPTSQQLFEADLLANKLKSLYS